VGSLWDESVLQLADAVFQEEIVNFGSHTCYSTVHMGLDLITGGHCAYNST